jgi:hypothetical protein
MIFQSVEFDKDGIAVVVAYCVKFDFTAFSGTLFVEMERAALFAGAWVRRN